MVEYELRPILVYDILDTLPWSLFLRVINASLYGVLRREIKRQGIDTSIF